VKDRARSISGIMEDLAGKLKLDTPRVEEQIMRHWRDIVGSDRAHRCKPSKISRDHTLIITTTNTTLRMELQFDRARILARIQAFCGDTGIREVQVR
jgi:predicted nucleic acid-binding Zn ribbon protein